MGAISDRGGGEWSSLLVLLANLLAYFMVLGFVIIMIFLVLKISSYFVNVTEEEAAGEDAIEIDPLLLQQKTAVLYAYYGTCGDHQESLAAATCSSSSSSSSSNGVAAHDDNHGSDDQVKLCVICYDEERNSFFVPCGHSATCLACARRIYNEENKVCPVCRRLIGRVKKL